MNYTKLLAQAFYDEVEKANPGYSKNQLQAAMKQAVSELKFTTEVAPVLVIGNAVSINTGGPQIPPQIAAIGTESQLFYFGGPNPTATIVARDGSWSMDLEVESYHTPMDYIRDVVKKREIRKFDTYLGNIDSRILTPLIRSPLEGDLTVAVKNLAEDLMVGVPVISLYVNTSCIRHLWNKYITLEAFITSKRIKIGALLIGTR